MHGPGLPIEYLHALGLIKAEPTLRLEEMELIVPPIAIPDSGLAALAPLTLTINGQGGRLVARTARLGYPSVMATSPPTEMNVANVLRATEAGRTYNHENIRALRNMMAQHLRIPQGHAHLCPRRV